MRKAHELDVSLSEKNSHIFCSACSKGNMRGGMATATYLLIFGVRHGLGNFIHILYLYGKVFDLMLLIHSSILLFSSRGDIFVQYLPCYFLQLQWMRLHYNPMRHCLHLLHMV